MQQNRLERLVSQTKGRFFGVYTRTGEAINTQNATVSPHFLTVVDRNTGKLRRLKRANVSHLAIGGKRYRV